MRSSHWCCGAGIHGIFLNKTIKGKLIVNTQGQEEMCMKVYPAVPRHWLLAIAGIIWIAVGLLLCIRAIVWLAAFALSTLVALETIGLLLAIVGYVYGFSKIVQKNINRINRLPDMACAFAFAAWGGYVMVGFMVTVGIALRNSPIPKQYLAMPYTAMGAILLTGGVRLFRQFLASHAAAS